MLSTYLLIIPAMQFELSKLKSSPSSIGKSLEIYEKQKRGRNFPSVKLLNEHLKNSLS